MLKRLSGVLGVALIALVMAFGGAAQAKHGADDGPGHHHGHHHHHHHGHHHHGEGANHP
jgi:hypothetical protein